MSSTEATLLGRLLKQWRAQRQYSQVKLAELAEVSTKHLSFVETGRTNPSREMVLRLAAALDVPLGVRNSLLNAAGFASIHPARDVTDNDAMARIRVVLAKSLERHEPHPAVVISRRGDLLLANRGMQYLNSFLGLVPSAQPRPNLMLSMFDPNGLRPFIADWPDVARFALRRLSRDADALGGDPELLELIEQICKMPGVPTDWRHVCKLDETLPCLSFALIRGNVQLHWMSTITSFGTPQDVTLHGLTIESFFPADDATETRWLEIVASAQRLQPHSCPEHP
jgi:transcriptional regulator with XRE-family HTH domain